MPYRIFDTNEVSQYLHLDKQDLERLVKDQDIPFERRGSRVLFRKMDIDAWASKRILGLESARLVKYHHLSSAAAATFLESEGIMPQMGSSIWIEPVLPAKTRASAIREMVSLAGKSGRVADGKALLASIEAREELFSTGLPGGLALLHPCYPDPTLIEESFIALGRTPCPVPFGAPDRAPTDLFFLLCCPDDRLHLHALARLCLMAHKTDLLSRLRDVETAREMEDEILRAETAIIPGRR